MYTSPLPLIGWAATFAIFALAWWKGGPAERYGATLKLTTSLVALAVHLLLKQESISVALLVADGVLAVGFLLLAIRYASLWTGACMILQAGQFSLHAYYLVSELQRDRLYAVANNLVTLGILVCILTGTLVAWRRRSRLQAA
jgi:hypothetical protein